MLVILAILALAQAPATDKLITLDMNGSIKQFLQSIAATSGLEVVIDPAIDRDVTVHVRDVPWEWALDGVLRGSGLSSTIDGRTLRVAASDPRVGQDRVLVGTLVIAGKITEFKLQNPRSLLEVNAPDPDGNMKKWQIEWENAEYLTETGIKPNTLKPGDPVIVTGSLTRANALHLVIVRRSSDGFTWGSASSVRFPNPDGLMFVSSAPR
jgi:Family of unknown function (DUF6152)